MADIPVPVSNRTQHPRRKPDVPMLPDAAPASPASGSKRPLWRRPSGVAVTLLLCVLGVVFLSPLLWMINASLRPEARVLDFPPGMSVLGPQWSNYQHVLAIIPRNFLNSVRLAAFNVVGSLVVASMAGFGFARLHFPGRDALFGAILLTAIIPNVVYIIPQFIIFQKIGWIDTFYPLWVPQVLTPVFGTFIMRQAFKTLPLDYEEAARVDGASTFRIFLTIMLPQAKAGLAAVATFSFLSSWNDLFGPIVFLNSGDKQTLPVALAQFQGEFFTQVSLLMAGATITIVPVLLVFVIAQRFFIQGLSGGIKG